MLKHLLLLLVCGITCGRTQAQDLELLTTGTKTNLRGLDAFKNTIWASGSNGYTGRSADNGATWTWQQVKGYETNDFRDIAVLDENTALIMAIGSPAYLLKTTDGGKSWKKVYENKDSAMFLDALFFDDQKTGYVIGDPVHNKIFIAQTRDGGDSWQPAAVFASIQPLAGEAFFAASGSNLTSAGGQLMLVSGGNASRLITGNTTVTLPLMQGSSSTGANGIAAFGRALMVAGGDFQQPARKDSVLVISRDNGKTFVQPVTGPGGYRSAVAALDDSVWITCGLNGVDLSTDGGQNWTPVSAGTFNSVFINRTKKVAFLAGPAGTVGSIRLQGHP
ncbi:WD40/YVTN/BNR-like repeat-containing protein [Niabella beijingensis]|uniref:WD40/YVTN/BNR-like repeat-containing protein n=1 Tax=Niabella beijingensis TaxID=2872700 RepID=UPI001CBDC791|nr:YCF48-related protein [Niabella beijingensis]MBZ4192094.1 oxidoreductase [Niabella beijingensis]